MQSLVVQQVDEQSSRPREQSPVKKPDKKKSKKKPNKIKINIKFKLGKKQYEIDFKYDLKKDNPQKIAIEMKDMLKLPEDKISAI